MQDLIHVSLHLKVLINVSNLLLASSTFGIISCINIRFRKNTCHKHMTFFGDICIASFNQNISYRIFLTSGTQNLQIVFSVRHVCTDFSTLLNNMCLICQASLPVKGRTMIKARKYTVKKLKAAENSIQQCCRSNIIPGFQRYRPFL